MPHEGYADPVMNDRPGFHSNVPISELTEHDTRAIEESDVSSTGPSDCENCGWGDDHKDKPTLNRTLSVGGVSRKVGLTRRPNARS